MKTRGQNGNALAIGIVGVLVLAVAIFAIWRWWVAAHPTTPAPQANTNGLTAGTDTSSLTRDVATITTAVNKENGDLGAAAAALSQQQTNVAGPALKTVASEVMQTNRQLDTLAQKIQSRIDEAKSAGKQVASLQNDLSAANEIMTEAGITVNYIQPKLAALTVQDSTSSLLSDYRNQLVSLHQQNVAALARERSLVASLGSL